MKTVGSVVVTMIVIVVLVVGGWFAYWKIAEATNNKQAHLKRTTFEQQTTYRDEMVRKISEAKAIDAQILLAPEVAPQLKAQRQSIIDVVCRDNTHINGGLDNKTQQFVSENC